MIPVNSPLLTEIFYQDASVTLTIRPLKKEDASLLNQAVKESLVDLLPFMDWAHGELSEANQLNRILASQQNYSKGLEYDFAVFSTTGEFIASASWHPSKSRNVNSLEIGYWTHSEHCNKGLATLVTKILTVVAFEFMNCDRVEIGCNKANIRSKRVIHKCGFVYEGEIRNYFSKPTEEMLGNHYSPERSYLSYSFILDDLIEISWYSDVKNHLKIS